MIGEDNLRPIFNLYQGEIIDYFRRRPRVAPVEGGRDLGHCTEHRGGSSGDAIPYHRRWAKAPAQRDSAHVGYDRYGRPVSYHPARRDNGRLGSADELSYLGRRVDVEG